MPPLRTTARFPAVPKRAGHYESFYLKACHPEGGLGVWIRYTVHKRPEAEPKGFVWFALFDAREGVRASKVEHPDPQTSAADYLRAGSSVFAPGRVVGSARSERLDAGWDLKFECDEPTLMHLPREWMYRARIPRTKVESPYPAAVFRGTLHADGRIVSVDGWPGMVGHNWGSEHARRGIWLHGTNFEGHEQAWFDVTVGRVAFGPLTTPWIAGGALSLDGRRHRLGGLERIRPTRIAETPERCEFVLTGEDVVVEGVAGAARDRFVSWIYAQPTGVERQTVNSSIADVTLKVKRARSAPVTLEVRGGGAYELQMEERYPAIPIQPFPDG